MRPGRNINNYLVMRNFIKNHDFAYEYFLFISISSVSIILVSLLTSLNVDIHWILGTCIFLFCILIYFIVTSLRIRKEKRKKGCPETIKDGEVHITGKEITKEESQADPAQSQDRQNDATLKIYNYEMDAPRFLTYFARVLEAVQGLYYQYQDNNFLLQATYAFDREQSGCQEVKKDDGFIGAVLSSKKMMIIENVPQGYLRAFSGLGESDPAYLIFIPIMVDGSVFGIMELATFKYPTEEKIDATNYLINNAIRFKEKDTNAIRTAV
jgi:GAF domain